MIWQIADGGYQMADTGDSGYHHLPVPLAELLRYRRTYSEGANKKGERAKPMYDTEQWLRQTVLN